MPEIRAPCLKIKFLANAPVVGPTCLSPDAFYHLASAALTQVQDVALVVPAAPLPAMVSAAAEPQSELD